MFGIVIWLLILIAGIILMTFASDKAVEHSIFCASIFGMSQFMIGFVLVSLGTDLPEIINSIVSNYLGHPDVNAGNSIGSVLSQLTLVLGILALISNPFKVKKKEIIVVGSCLLSSLIALSLVVSIGFSRITALLLIRKHRLGYILTPIFLVFIIILAIALTGMVIMLKVRGISDETSVAGIFIILAIISVIFLFVFLSNIKTIKKN